MQSVTRWLVPFSLQRTKMRSAAQYLTSVSRWVMRRMRRLFTVEPSSGRCETSLRGGRIYKEKKRKTCWESTLNDWEEMNEQASHSAWGPHIFPDVFACIPVGPAALRQQIENRCHPLFDLFTLKEQKKKKHKKNMSPTWYLLFMHCCLRIILYRLQASFHEHQQSVDAVHVDPTTLLRIRLRRHHQQHVETLQRQRWQQVDSVTVKQEVRLCENIESLHYFTQGRLESVPTAYPWSSSVSSGSKHFLIRQTRRMATRCR